MREAPHELSAAEAARRIARKELSSEALVRSCLERIGEREGDVAAWEFLDPQLALEQARACDRQPPQSALHGVPVGIKDILDTADMPSQYGSPIYRGHRPKADAACVALLRAAGCVILGKTVTTEFANVHSAQTRNPHDREHTPGGSSSGSAAAVADRMVPLALGTQTGGSTIRPSAYCGIVGMKPTFNTINRAGLKFSSEALDTIGLCARTVEDVALAFQILSDQAVAPRPPRTAAPRIGLYRTSRWQQADAASQANLESAAAQLAASGARVSEFELFPGGDALYDGHAKIALFEAARALAWEYAHHREKLSADILAKLEEGWQIPRADYDAARSLVHECRGRFADQLEDYDFLLTLSAPDEAPRGFANTGSPVFNRIWTWLGVPCLTLPRGRGANGLPLGVQLVGAFDTDAELLAWAAWVADRFE